MKLRPVAMFVAGAVFSVGIIGTTSWIRAADNNLITACAHKKTGTMRYLTKGKCKSKSETPVTWNLAGIPGPGGSTGDKGAKGETGVAGTKGDAGARGPSDAWVYTAGNTTLGLSDAVVVESATLPAGSYTSVVNLSLENNDVSVTAGMVCTLAPSSYDTGNVSAEQRVPVALHGAVTLTSPGKISVTCRRKDAAMSMVNSAVLVITQVETLTIG